MGQASLRTARRSVPVPLWGSLEETESGQSGVFCQKFATHVQGPSLIATWIALPIELRLVILSLMGVLLGAAANDAVYRLAWFSRPISPWMKPDARATNRTWLDRIPIVGWFSLRRESGIHGSGFWVRPMLIEIAVAIGVPALYWFETQTGLLLPAEFRAREIVAKAEPWMTMVFASHFIMVGFMVAATFIDFDEQTIPDAITIPGTLIALGLASCSLRVFMPAPNVAGPPDPMLFFTPGALLPKWHTATGFWTATALWTGWCFALANRRVILRRGLAKAVEYFIASLVRYPTWKLLLAIWIVGLIAIRWLFSVGGATWIGLLTALIGLGVGGGVVWAIRIVGSVAMGREALGFGDVTLMAMIGAFIGWQGAVMSFFAAPIAAIVIVLVYFVVTRNSEIPFGPYLCAGTLITVFLWDRLVSGWFLANLAFLGPFMLWLFIALTGIMGVMLFVWRLFKERYIYE